MVCPNWPTLKPGTHAWYTRHAGREPVNVEDQARMRKGHPTGPLPPDFRSRDRSSPATRSLIPGVSASRSPAVAAVLPLHPCGDRRRDAGEHDAHADHPVTDTKSGSRLPTGSPRTRGIRSGQPSRGNPNPPDAYRHTAVVTGLAASSARSFGAAPPPPRRSPSAANATWARGAGWALAPLDTARPAECRSLELVRLVGGVQLDQRRVTEAEPAELAGSGFSLRPQPGSYGSLEASVRGAFRGHERMFA